MAFVSASSSIEVAGNSFLNQAGPRTLMANGAKEGENTSYPKRALYAIENNSCELPLPCRSMAKPIPSVDLFSYASVKLVGRKTASLVLKVAKSHSWNNQIGPGMIRLLPGWYSLILVTAWFRFSYRDPNMSLLKQIFLPSCSWIAKVLKPLGTCIDLEQKNIHRQPIS